MMPMMPMMPIAGPMSQPQISGMTGFPGAFSPLVNQGISQGQAEMFAPSIEMRLMGMQGSGAAASANPMSAFSSGMMEACCRQSSRSMMFMMMMLMQMLIMVMKTIMGEKGADSPGAPGIANAGTGGASAPAAAQGAGGGGAVAAQNGQTVTPLENYRVSSEFGPRWGTQHTGIDLAAATGTPIRAAADGVVTRVSTDSGGYGNWVEIRHKDGSTTRYAHMSKFAGINQGQQVGAGTVIGYVGSTGNSTGPHLHFEWRDPSGKAVNPREKMKF